ncbi:MAG TPA: hypothetical protein VFO56_08385 [Gaiellaceae bacterium]|nr:hypothetical protein [Gaiellaceae bacterium]
MKTRDKTKVAILAAGAVTIVTGLAAAGAVTAARAISPGDESQSVIADAAGQLGIEPAALSDALKQALKHRIDAAVDAGRLTEAQGDELKRRIDSAGSVPLFGGFGHHRGLGHFRSLEAAADYLGLTEAELREQLQDKTLAEIAKDKGKTVAGLVQALVTSAEKAIDEAVADGRLTDEQATELKANLQDRIEALVNGEFRSRGLGFHHRFGSGDASPRAPPFFWGPRA